MSQLVEDLRTEADLCRNEGATDIAGLLDDAADKIGRLQRALLKYGDRIAMANALPELQFEIDEAFELESDAKHQALDIASIT
jgi:hypothetical protein